MADLFIYENGKWVSRDTVEMYLNGAFEESVGFYVYNNGSWEPVYEPELLHLNPSGTDTAEHAHDGLDTNNNRLNSGGVYGDVAFKTTGLVAHFDAGQSSSYPGSGNVWYDISGNDNHAKGDPNDSSSSTDSTRFPLWESDNGGRFYFDGSRGLIVTSDMGTQSAVTHEMWVKRTDTSDSTQYISDSRGGSGTYLLSNYNSHNINFGSKLEASDPATYQSNSNWWSRWTHIAITNDGTTSKLFIDGQEITDSRLKNSNSFDMDIGPDFRIGVRYTGTSRFSGYMSQYRIYDHTLTQTEIENHYEASKSRYL